MRVRPYASCHSILDCVPFESGGVDEGSSLRRLTSVVSSVFVSSRLSSHVRAQTRNVPIDVTALDHSAVVACTRNSSLQTPMTYLRYRPAKDANGCDALSSELIPSRVRPTSDIRETVIAHTAGRACARSRSLPHPLITCTRRPHFTSCISTHRTSQLPCHANHDASVHSAQRRPPSHIRCNVDVESWQRRKRLRQPTSRSRCRRRL